MTNNEQILELAEKFNFCYRNEDGWRKWKVSPDIIIKFALQVHEMGYNEGYEQCSFDMGDENV
jgi:hypothetical protein